MGNLDGGGGIAPLLDATVCGTRLNRERLLSVQVNQTPGLYAGPGVYPGPGFYPKFYGNNNNNAIYIAQIRAQQQMGCRVISVQTERLSA